MTTDTDDEYSAYLKFSRDVNKALDKTEVDLAHNRYVECEYRGYNYLGSSASPRVGDALHWWYATSSWYGARPGGASVAPEQALAIVLCINGVTVQMSMCPRCGTKSVRTSLPGWNYNYVQRLRTSKLGTTVTPSPLRVGGYVRARCPHSTPMPGFLDPWWLA